MKKFLSSILIFVFILCSFTLYSNAADASISYSVSTPSITVGSEFDTILSVTQLGHYTNGINAVEGFLSYDECLELVSITAANPNLFQNPGINSSNNKFYILTQEMNLVPAGPVLKIRFRLKTRPASTTKVATLSNVKITDGGVDEIEFQPVSITLTIKDPVPENNTTGNNTTGGNTSTGNNTIKNNTITNNTTGNTSTGNNTVSNNTTGNNTMGNNTIKNNTTGNNLSNNSVSNKNGNNTIFIKNTSSNNSYNDSSTSNKAIPYTGFSSFIIICISFILVAGIISYHRYKNLKLH